MIDLHPDLQALIGSVIHERYRVDGLLGQGGMGAVFRGHHLGLARDVAIKVLRPELGRSDSTAKRFDREAHSVSRLDHPNCVRVTDFGTTESGIKYLVMELLEGAELEDSLGQPWAPARAVDTIIQVLEGLEHAHHFGIVHRDLKPENVFVTRDFRGREVVKLVDFGIAKLIDDEGAKEQLTRAGMVFGTPRYMSPEQASGGKLDERTDLYAAGLILYEMLAGHPPFSADEAALLLRMHILAPPPELPSSVPKPLAAVVDKLLEKSRNDRYASAREVINVLAQLRPELEHVQVAAPSPAAATGPIATPSMATHAEARSGTSWNPAAAPGASQAMPAPAPPAMPAPAPPAMEIAALPNPPAAMPVPPPPGPGARTGAAEPNIATGAQPGSLGDPSMAITSHAPLVQPNQPKPARPWLPWAITGAAIMLALMAFGAGQALQADGATSDTGAANPGTESQLGDPFAHYDRECSNQDRCELSCGEDCSARCTDAAYCELEVGPNSRVFCDHFGKCEVHCSGDCRVECPQGGCKVSCPGAGHGNKSKKAKKPKKCGTVYVCGNDCDDQ